MNGRKKVRNPKPKYEVNVILEITEAQCGVDSSLPRQS